MKALFRFAGLTGRAGQYAKVGQSKEKTPSGLAARMPSAAIAAKVGVWREEAARSQRVLRRNAQ